MAELFITVKAFAIAAIVNRPLLDLSAMEMRARLQVKPRMPTSIWLRTWCNRFIVFACKRRKLHSVQVVSGEWKKHSAT